jgi:PAS domain S-box-containing protein
LPTLTRIEQIRGLKLEEAKRGYRVRIRAVVTYCRAADGDLFIQDSTAGVWVDPKEFNLNLRSGQLIEVEGTAGVGDFSPEIDKARVRILGEAPLPVPRRVSGDELASGRQDSQWVEVQAVVRSATERGTDLTLNASSGAYHFKVFVPDYGTPPTDLVDSVVRVRGVFAGTYTLSGLFTGFQILVPSRSGIQIVRRPSDGLFSLPVRPIHFFLRLTPEGAFTHRVHVQGVVTYQGAGLLYIRDQDEALLIHLSMPTAQASQDAASRLSGSLTSVKVGDLVDVVGFPELGDYAPVMRDAVFRKIGVSSPPQPVRMSVEKALHGDHDADLVRLSGELLNRTDRDGQELLELQAGNTIFRAEMEKENGTRPLDPLRPGSLLELTGIRRIEVDDNRAPRAFSLLLRSPADIVVLKRPPWWTLRKGLAALAMLMSAVLAVLGWVAVLRRRVRSQTELIRERLESEAALEKRYQRLFERNLSGIWRASLDGRLLDCNDALATMLGYSSREELLGRQIVGTLIAQADDEAFLAELKAEKKLSNRERGLQRKDGSELWVIENATLVDDAEGCAPVIEITCIDITDRKQAEEQTRLQTAALESAANGIIITNQEGHIIWANPAFTLLSGYSKAEILGQNPRIWKSEVQDAGFYQQLWKTILSGEVWSGEIVNRRKDGTLYTEEMTVTPVRDPHGAIRHFIAIKQDITARKRAEKALEERTAYLNTLIEISPMGIVVVDPEGLIEMTNRAFERLFLYSREEMLGVNLDDLVAPPELLTEAKGLTGQCRSGAPVHTTTRRLRQDGTLVEVEISAVPLVLNGQPRGLMALYQDISQRQRAEEALRESEKRYRRLFEHNLAGVLRTTLDGRILDCNQAMAKMVGFDSPREVLARRVPDFYYSSEDRDLFLERIKAEGHLTNFEMRLRHKDGSPVWLIVNLTLDSQSAGGSQVIEGTLVDITARKRAEEEVRESSELVRLLLDSIPEAVYGIDMQGNCTFCNPSCLRLLGYPEAADLHGKNMHDLIHHTRQDGTPHPVEECHIYEAFRRGHGTHIDDEVLWRRDGSNFPAEYWSRPIHRYGNVIGTVVTFVDITDRRQAEADLLRYARDLETAKAAQEKHAGELAHLVEELAHERDLLRILMDNIPDAIYFKDSQSRFTRVNSAQARTLGIEDSAEALGKTDFDFFPREDAEHYLADEKRIIETDQPLIGKLERVLDAQGKFHWVSNTAVPVKNAQGRVTGIVGVARDVNDWKAALEALRDSEERYRELFENASDIVYTTDLTGRLTSLNRVAEQIMGYSRDEALQINFGQLMDGKNIARLDRAIEQLYVGGSAPNLEIEITAKDGRRVMLEVKPRLICKDGKVIGVQGIARDITGRNVAEMELRHAQKLESVGRLASGIAHEINTPIQFVGDNARFLQDSFGGLQTLLNKYQVLRDAAAADNFNPDLLAEVRRTEEETDYAYLQEEIPKALTQTLEGVTRVATIVRAMKEFAHPESKEMAAADLNRALLSTLTVARNELKYVADVETDLGNLPLVVCNIGDLNQVFLNLLVNAAHAISDVVKGSEKKGKIRVRTMVEDSMALVAISDTGSGIPEAIRTRIFDPFFTTKEVGRGTGQGLAIARSVVVDRHKGTLTFESEEGKGTTFFIRLPFEPGEGAKETRTT